jgi:hypothetical protein
VQLLVMRRWFYTPLLEVQMVLASRVNHQQGLEPLLFLLLVQRLAVQLQLVCTLLKELQVLKVNQASRQQDLLSRHEALRVQETETRLFTPFIHISELRQLVVLELQTTQSFTPTLELVTARALRRQVTPP